MTVVRVARDYPHPPAKVWRALTDPALMAQWGMRPEGFAPVPGTRFRLFGKPNRAWRGFVDCQVLEAREAELLRYRWDGDGKSTPTELAYRLEPRAGGTRLTIEHRGFLGLRGFIFAKLIMTPGWKKMANRTFPAVLDQIGR